MVAKIPFASKVPSGVIRSLPNYPAGREGFFQWLRDTYPAVYARAGQYVSTLEGLGDDTVPTSPTNSDNWASQLATALPALASAYNQQRVISLQIDRAKQGLQPLPIDQYTGDASFKAGVDTSTQKTLLMVAGIIGAALILPALLRR